MWRRYRFRFHYAFPTNINEPLQDFTFWTTSRLQWPIVSLQIQVVFMIYNNGFVCRNFVVQTMPTPLYDAMSASKLNPEKTEAALQTVSTNYYIK